MFRLESLFRGVHLDLDDEVYIYQAGRTGFTEDYQLYEVYKIFHQGAPITNKVGHWSKASNSLNFMTQDKNTRRADMRVSPQSSFYILVVVITIPGFSQ